MATTAEFVSVIMPAYNAALYVAEAVESVLAQTHPNFELVVVDDGSTDGTSALLEEFAERDERISVHWQENAGVVAAANKALSLARGELVARMDADDVMFPERLSRQVEFLNAHPEIALVGTEAVRINAAGQPIGTYASLGIHTKEDCARAFARGETVMPLQPTIMFRKAAVLDVGGYRPEYRGGNEDLDLYSRMLEKGYYLVVIPERLLKYRMHNASAGLKSLRNVHRNEWARDNIRRRRQGLAEIDFEAYRRAFRALPLGERFRRLRKLKAEYYFRMASIQYGYRRYFSFFTFIARALTCDFRVVSGKIRRQLQQRRRLNTL